MNASNLSVMRLWNSALFSLISKSWLYLMRTAMTHWWNFSLGQEEFGMSVALVRLAAKFATLRVQCWSRSLFLPWVDDDGCWRFGRGCEVGFVAAECARRYWGNISILSDGFLADGFFDWSFSCCGLDVERRSFMCGWDGLLHMFVEFCCTH